MIIFMVCLSVVLYITTIIMLLIFGYYYCRCSNICSIKKILRSLDISRLVYSIYVDDTKYV